MPNFSSKSEFKVYNAAGNHSNSMMLQALLADDKHSKMLDLNRLFCSSRSVDRTHKDNIDS